MKKYLGTIVIAIFCLIMIGITAYTIFSKNRATSGWGARSNDAMNVDGSNQDSAQPPSNTMAKAELIEEITSAFDTGKSLQAKGKRKENLTAAGSLPYSVVHPSGWILHTVAAKDHSNYVEFFSPDKLKSRIFITPYGGKYVDLSTITADFVNKELSVSSKLISLNILSERMYKSASAEIFQQVLNAQLEDSTEDTVICVSSLRDKYKETYVCVLTAPKSQYISAVPYYTRLLNTLQSNAVRGKVTPGDHYVEKAPSSREDG